jgi:hypothetical protein
MASKLDTWEEAIRDAIESDEANLVEFAEGSVVLGDDLSPKNFDSKIQAAARLSEGLCLIIYGAAGNNPDTDASKFDVSLKAELYISPTMRDVVVNPALRGANEILEALIQFLHGGSFSNASGHCYGRTTVQGFAPVNDPDFKVQQLTLGRDLTL